MFRSRKLINNFIFSNNHQCYRPFYRYGGHIELIRFKEYDRMPRGHEHISFVFSSAFRDIFFLNLSQNKIVMGKKILVSCLDVKMIAFFQFSVRNMDCHLFFSGKRRSLLHQNTARGSFCPLESYSKKTLRKNVPKSARKYKRNVLMPPGHPIILLKSN